MGDVPGGTGPGGSRRTSRLLDRGVGGVATGAGFSAFALLALGFSALGSASTERNTAAVGAGNVLVPVDETLVGRVHLNDTPGLTCPSSGPVGPQRLARYVGLSGL